MSPGLKRAREPYRVKNAIVGLTLGAFAVGVWAYSISAVRQDVFDDVDEEAKALAAPAAVAAPPAPLLAKEAAEAAVVEVVVPAPAVVVAQALPSVDEKTTVSPARGVLQQLGPRLPWLLDPTRKTLVWGAPPVDSVGKISRS